ncbi:MAG: HAMP domain-containing histidine kinase, partial [Candidatus Eremiobacteraeota bacterium]|nr:HAMP domain-containing histidine kinase [Candidatus Eremiobacteraeota bacterium]
MDAERRLTRMLTVVVVAWSVFALHYLLLGRYFTVAIDVSVVLCTLAARVRLSGRSSVERLAHHALAYSVAGLTLAALLSGQSRSLAVWYLCAVPVFAGFLMGARGAMIWSGVAAAASAVVDLSHLMWDIPPEFVPLGLELGAGRILLIMALLGLTLAFRLTSEEQLRELARARQAAEQANQSRERFLALAGHEFRTPMNSIQGFNQMLLDGLAGELNERQLRYCTNVQASARKLQRLLEGALQLTAQSEPLDNTQQFDPLPLLEQLNQEFSGGFQLGQIASEANLRCDRQRLTGILRHLIENALKFSPPHGRVLVDLQRHAGWLEFAVSDEGP